jgi:hypothetical protein
MEGALTILRWGGDILLGAWLVYYVIRRLMGHHLVMYWRRSFKKSERRALQRELEQISEHGENHA